nr:UBN2_3 domain-containing protein [Tanacetum cinerariifolium]
MTGSPPLSPNKTKPQTSALVTPTLLDRLAQLLSEQVSTFQTSSQIITHHEGGIPPITIKLNGQNYGLWCQMAEMHLSSKDKTCYIDGSLKLPPLTDPTYKKWKTKDSTVKGWLINSMDPSLVGNFIRFRNARNVWLQVELAFFDKNDNSQLYQLKRKVIRVKQSNRHVQEYFKEFVSLWREIDFRRPNSMKCPEDIKKHNDLTQEDRVYVFLDGLDNYLYDIRGEVLRMKPFPNVEEAFVVIRQEDSRKSVMLGKEEENFVAMAINSQLKYKPRGLNAGLWGARVVQIIKEKETTWCRTQHEQDNNGIQQFTFQTVASCCKAEKRKERVDFESKNDYKLEKGVVAVNILGGNNVGDEVFSTWMAFGGNTRDFESFEEETDKITDLHQIHEEVLSIERGDGVAVIKRRCCDLSSDDVRNLVTASGGGTISLSHTMTLTNTLLDILAKEIIGRGGKRGRLYHLEDVKSSVNLVKGVSNNKNKSHRASCPSSMNKINTPFDLVHYDVWGPSPVSSKSGYI